MKNIATLLLDRFCTAHS